MIARITSRTTKLGDAYRRDIRLLTMEEKAEAAAILTTSPSALFACIGVIGNIPMEQSTYVAVCCIDRTAEMGIVQRDHVVTLLGDWSIVCCRSLRGL